MGGGPDKEELLLTLPFPQDGFPLDELRTRQPDINVTYVQLSKDNSVDIKPLYKKATILVTLGMLPSDPDDVPNLKFIHLLSAGVDKLVSSPIFKSTTIPITTSSGIHGPPIAEWLLASVLGLTRRSFQMRDWQRDHRWGGSAELGVGGISDWQGKTVGIAGYGGIGRHIARVFVALGARVHAYTASPRATPASRRDTGYHLPGTGDPDGSLPAAWYSGSHSHGDGGGDGKADGKAALHTFLRSGLDLCVVALPLTPATEGMFGAEEFRILGGASSNDAGSSSGETQQQEKATATGKAFLVNIARGKIVDTAALVAALNDGTLAGAALDVTEPEPLPKEDPLWDAKNCVVTPHVSALGREYVERALGVLEVNLGRLKEGRDLVNEVKRGRGY